MLKNKLNGFTLIELLGVVILLAIISLIATPIILNVIKEAQESADMSSANLIVSNGHNYYAASLLDESKQEKIDNYQDIYEELDIQNKPEIGQLYVNSNDKVAMAVIINNRCYKKDYMTDIEVVDVSECDLGYMGPDEVKPTISQTASNTNINENGWYKEDIYLTINVTDNESGVFGYKRCVSQSECEPEDTIYTNESILINIESASNYVCVIGVDKRGNESYKNCEIYKLDKTLPTIEGIGDKTININEPIDLNDGVTYDDNLSGIDGELVIEPTIIDTSTIGTKQVIYKVQDLAGNVREVVRNIIVDADAPSIVFSLMDSNSINENGWANKDFYIRATITDNSGSGIKLGSSCTVNSSSECTPSASFTGTTKDFLITTEGSNRACVQVTDNNNKTSKVCSDTYNLDKTAPTAGTANFSGTLGSNNWYTTNVTVNVEDGSDSLSGHSSTTSSITSITSNTASQTVTITTTDKAGNSSTRSYTIKVDKNSPTLSAKSSNVTITVGDSYPVENLYNVSYSISGGSVVCKNGSTTISNLNSLPIGSYTITCTATGGNGKSSSVNISVKVKNIGYTYAVSGDGAIFRSVVGSGSWTFDDCVTGSNCLLGGTDTWNITMNDKYVYAVSGDGAIFRSVVGSGSWTFDDCATGSNCLLGGTDTWDITMNDEYVYAVSGDGAIFRSVVGSGSWTFDDCATGSNCLLGGTDTWDITMNDEYVYAVSGDGAIFRSVVGSGSWTFDDCATGSNCLLGGTDTWNITMN